MNSVGLLTLSLCLTLGCGVVVAIFVRVWVAKNRLESVPLLAKVNGREFVFTVFLFVCPFLPCSNAHYFFKISVETESVRRQKSRKVLCQPLAKRIILLATLLASQCFCLSSHKMR